MISKKARTQRDPLMVAAAALAIPATLGAAPVPEPRPNIIIFIGDDISPDFGCYGHPTIKTPNVDRLATRGVRFNNAYLTAPSCSPSRTSLLTGRYPHNTGGPELHMKKNPHLAGLPQFPALLRNDGYYTALAGKAHFNGNAKGSFDKMYPPGDAAGSANWLNALKDRPKDKPFLMWLAAIDAHRGWDLKPGDGPHEPKDAVVPPYLVDAKRTRTDLAQYYDEVNRFDTNIGKVLAELEAQKIADNTIVIVMADNGRAFPRDKTWIFDGGIKTPLIVSWPGRTKTPTVSESLVSSIDIAPTVLGMVGLPVPSTVQGVSFLPLIEDPKATIRDVVFAERNWHVYRHHDRLVRCGNYTYIQNSTPQFIGFNSMQQIHRRPEKIDGASAATDLIQGYWEKTLTAPQAFALTAPAPAELLFDVSQDPYQIKNLAADPGHAATLATMQTLLAAWTRETGDTTPPVDRMTPDRSDRKTGVSIQQKGRPAGGEFPGQTTQAWTINASGPIRVKE